jgi:sugar porter (SP) family MFS transporter
MSVNENLLGSQDTPKVTSTLLTSACIAVLGAFQFGYQIGVLNEPQVTIEGDLNIDHNSFKWSALVAAFTLAGLLGAQFSGGLIDSWGRKAFMRYNSIIFIAGGGLEMVAGLVRSSPNAGYGLLIFARIVMGVGCGAATVVVPLYLGEVAHTAVKGAFGALNQFTVTIAILVAQAIGLGMSTSALWGWMLFVSCAAGILGLVASPLMVESPRWLVSKGRPADAMKVLTLLRGVGEEAAQEEIQEIESSVVAGKQSAAPTFWSVLSCREFRKPIIVIIALQVAQQLSGINAVFFYSTTFFDDAGIANANYGTLATGAVNVIATGIAVAIIDKFGRKKLLLTGSVGMLAAAAALTATLVAKVRVCCGWLLCIGVCFMTPLCVANQPPVHTHAPV